MKQLVRQISTAIFGAALAGTLSVSAALGADQPEIDSINVPRDIGAGFIEAGLVRLDGPAGKDGVIVYIANDHPHMISHPGRIFIKPGHDSGRFPIRASQQAKSRIVKFGASTGDDGAVDKMYVRAAPAQSRTLMQRNVPIRHRVPY